MKKGDKVTVTATIDAFACGLNSGNRIRVRVGNDLVWISACDVFTLSDVDTESYVKDELKRRLALMTTD